MKYTTMLSPALLVAALVMAGCSNPVDTKPAETVADTPAPAAGHSHGSGPNGGVVFDLGNHHAEFTVDHGKQQCTILILGDDGQSPKPVGATELTLTINETATKDGTVVGAMTVAMSPEDAADGKATKFIGTDPGIGNIADFEGNVSDEIDGKPALGSFKE